MVKEHKYEEDLKLITDLKERSNKMIKLFLKLHEEFFDVSKLEDGTFIYPDKIISYVSTKKKDIEMMLKIMEEAGPFKMKNLEDTINDTCARMQINSFEFRNIIFKYNKNALKSKTEFVNFLKKLVDGLMVFLNYYDVFYTLIISLKTHIDRYATLFERKKDYFDSCYDSFSQYYELIIQKKIIPNDLVEEVIKFIKLDDFNTRDDKEDYIEGFRQYTKNHNNMVKEHENKVQTIKHTVIKDTLPKVEIVPKKEKIKTRGKENNEEEINEDAWNYANSYAPALMNLEYIPNLNDYLPPKSMPNYNQIIKAIFILFDEYCNSLQTFSMYDTYVYTQLEMTVESFKN